MNRPSLRLAIAGALAVLICINLGIAVAGFATYSELNSRLNRIQRTLSPAFATPPTTSPGETVAAAWFAIDGDYRSDTGFKQELLTLQDSGFFATGTTNFVDVEVLGVGETYQLHFGAAQGEQLSRGRYVTSSDRKGPSLGVSVTTSGGNCSNESASFDVFNVAVTRAGTVSLLLVSFEVNCIGQGALRGEVYFAAGVTSRVPSPPLLPQFTSATLFTAHGDPDDRLIGPTSYNDNAVNSKFEIGGGQAGVLAEITAPGQDFQLVFLPPIHKDLVPGTFKPAFDEGRRGSAAGLQMTANYHSCDPTAGSFDIVQMTYGPDGAVANLDITFELHCNGAVAATRGELRIERSWK